MCHNRLRYEWQPNGTLSVDAVSFRSCRPAHLCQHITKRKLNGNRKRCGNWQPQRLSKWTDNPYFKTSTCYIVVVVVVDAFVMEAIVNHSPNEASLRTQRTSDTPKEEMYVKRWSVVCRMKCCRSVSAELLNNGRWWWRIGDNVNPKRFYSQ